MGYMSNSEQRKQDPPNQIQYKLYNINSSPNFYIITYFENINILPWLGHLPQGEQPSPSVTLSINPFIATSTQVNWTTIVDQSPYQSVVYSIFMGIIYRARFWWLGNPGVIQLQTREEMLESGKLLSTSSASVPLIYIEPQSQYEIWFNSTSPIKFNGMWFCIWSTRLNPTGSGVSVCSEHFAAGRG